MTQPGLSALYNYYCEFDAINTLERYADTTQQPEPDYVRNFLGVRVPPIVFPPILDSRVGTVEPIPDPGNWHADIAEWAAALRAVDGSGDLFRVIELGCGWGCWITNTGYAARKTGRSVEMIGVEGDANHLKNAVLTLEANGFSEDTYTLFHGIAAGKPGKAIFPNVEEGSAAWGGEAIFEPDKDTLARAQDDASVQVLDCFTLGQLSADKTVDLLHIDIQGAETDYVKGNIDDMDRLVRRVLIGTHGRVIEGQLQEFFLDRGWRMEMDRATIAPLSDGRPKLGIDGVHLWANPKLT